MPAAQSALLCATPTFRMFLEERYGLDVPTGEAAVQAVRDLCGVVSRREMHRGTPSAACWYALQDQYFAWMREPLP